MMQSIRDMAIVIQKLPERMLTTIVIQVPTMESMDNRQKYIPEEKDQYLSIRYLLLTMIVIFGSAIAADKMGYTQVTPRQLPDKRVYRQWCCPHCEQYNSGYGPPYYCSRCGYKMDW